MLEEATFLGMTESSLTFAAWLAGGIAVTCLLARAWIGIMNHVLFEHHTEPERKGDHYFPSMSIVGGTLVGTGLIVVLSWHLLESVFPFSLLSESDSVLKVIGVLALAAIILQILKRRSRDFVFAFVTGSILSVVLIGFLHQLLSTDLHKNPFVMSLGFVSMTIMWHILFGPWKPRVKATVLGTFIFWIAVKMLLNDTPDERTAHLIAAGIALVPAVVWCWLFLEYHRQRMEMVFLMFFAGMISTAPILFYDQLVRHSVELQFFLFKVTPQNFNAIASSFVSSSASLLSFSHTTIWATFISFLIVGIIEEVSKYWVLRKSGRPFFTSIDDCIQLAVIVAIGFAFAENLLNPTYFIGFVKNYILQPETPQWMPFIGNIMGRSVLTTMVHIVSSGIAGYFLGLAVFARPYIEEKHRNHKVLFFADTLHWIFRLKTKRVFRIQMILTGLVIASVVHGMFNFLVTLPDILPGKPSTLGELFGFSQGHVLDHVSLLLIPSLLYVVGGFWLLTNLLYKEENRKERGHIVTVDSFVRDRAEA